MDREALYVLLKESVDSFAKRDGYFQSLPATPDFDLPLNDAGLDIVTLPEIVGDLKTRLGGRSLGLDGLLNPNDVNAMTIGNLLDQIKSSLVTKRKHPIVVYVDDEEDNLFVFNRKFGKRLNLKTFIDPMKALEYIRDEEDVALVITDEVMPNLSGNELCDEVHKAKPMMKFVLITGNPNHEDDLLYRSLRQNRFYEFINKPVEFEKKGEEYMKLFQSLMAYDV